MNSKAFSLIETMIVIMVLGVLVTIALPCYNRIIERSKMSEAALSMDAIHKAVNLCAYERPINDCMLFSNLDVSVSSVYWIYSLGKDPGGTLSYHVTATRPLGTLVLSSNDSSVVNIVGTGVFR